MLKGSPRRDEEHEENPEKIFVFFVRFVVKIFLSRFLLAFDLWRDLRYGF
jgi:hypothetical protein